MKKKRKVTTPTVSVAAKTQGPRALKPHNVLLFDSLTPLEYENLFLRTQCLLEFIKEAYSKLISQPVITRQMLLQFTFDPFGYGHQIDADNWELSIGEAEIILWEKSGTHRMEIVHDRPTFRLFHLFLDDVHRRPWNEELPKQCLG